MSRITHFEINAEAPEGIAEFYSRVFGWFIQKKWMGNEDYWLIHTGKSDEAGINGGLKKKINKEPCWIPTISVTSIDDMLSKIEKHGGKILKPKTKIPATGFIAYCEDPEGNPFCVLEKDSSIR